MKHSPFAPYRSLFVLATQPLGTTVKVIFDPKAVTSENKPGPWSYSVSHTDRVPRHPTRDETTLLYTSPDWFRERSEVAEAVRLLFSAINSFISDPKLKRCLKPKLKKRFEPILYNCLAFKGLYNLCLIKDLINFSKEPDTLASHPPAPLVSLCNGPSRTHGNTPSVSVRGCRPTGRSTRHLKKFSKLPIRSISGS